jgi:hypothetical protein
MGVWDDYARQMQEWSKLYSSPLISEMQRTQNIL